MPDTSTALDEHLHFLLNEVENHCIITETFFSKTENSCYTNICARHGYLKTLIGVMALNLGITSIHMRWLLLNAALEELMAHQPIELLYA